MKYCDKCNKTFDDSVKFCPECGNKLLSKDVCPECGAPVDANAKFCPSCGHKLVREKVCPQCGAHLEGDAKFCSKCGAKIDEGGFIKSEAKVENKEVAKKVTSSKVNDNNDELVAKATVKYERISSRKIAIVANLIRGKNVDEAMAILKFTPKAGAEVLTKLLKSAIANAENNNQMTHSKLYIAEIYSNQGPTLKRIRAAAKGSAVRIRKRTSNTTIVLKEREA